MNAKNAKYQSSELTTASAVSPDEVAVPALPARPPDRFQFRLKHLLAFMFVSAMVAFGIRLALDFVGQLPPGYLPGWLNVGLSAVSLGGLAYFFLRLPFVAVGVARVRNRWRTVQSHRRELAEWAKTRSSKPARIMDEEEAPKDK